MKCDICDNKQEVEMFHDWTCSNCGQVYNFDEGVIMSLTSDQYQVLRDHWLNEIRPIDREPDRAATLD